MKQFLSQHKYQLLLWFFIVVYAVYFSWFTILRYKTLYASYYDLGIMHQTVFNTYSAIKTGDWSRFLEMTNTTGPEQIKRMAIHNDLLLALLAPFYFISSGPETMLIIQAIVVALGALAVFKIAAFLFNKFPSSNLIAFVFSLSYLLYPPLQYANIFEFHAVTLATTLLLLMFYFWLVKRYWISFIFFALSLISKEQVALTTMMFGIFTIILNFKFLIFNQFKRSNYKIDKQELNFSLIIIGLSTIWFVVSVFYIIPIFRGGNHFATARYSDFGDSPGSIITGVVSNPQSIFKYIFNDGSLNYLRLLLGPLGFLSLLSPLQLLIAIPEFAINLLSKSANMRNIIYQYTAVITPFVFISAIYGARKVISYWLLVISKKKYQRKSMLFLATYVLLFALGYAYMKGPLPFAKTKNVHPIRWPQPQAKDAAFWGKTLRDTNLKISSTGQLSPFFTSRRYFYTFSARYSLADYVVLRPDEIYNYPEKAELIPVYERLIIDSNFRLIYKKENFEVYKRIK